MKGHNGKSIYDCDKRSFNIFALPPFFFNPKNINL